MANVTSALALLVADIAHINSITATGVVSVSLAAFTADQAALTKVVGGFAIADTAAHIVADHAAQIASLGGAGAKSIAATDASVVLSVAEAALLEGAGLKVSAPSGKTVTIGRHRGRHRNQAIGERDRWT